MRKEPELYSQTAARKLELFRDGIVGKMGEDRSPAEIFNTLRETKQGLQKIVFSKIPNAQEMESINLLNGVSKTINQTIKDPDVFGMVGSALAEHDEMLSKYYGSISPGKPTEFQKAFMKRVGNGPNTKWQFDANKVERVLKTSGKMQGQDKLNLLDNY
jgi:hypothetical protein